MGEDDFRLESYDSLKRGKIREISGTPGSGLWQIYFEDGFCHIQSGYGLRTLAECYGSLHNATGKLIRYETDELNVMTYFLPEDDFPLE